MKKTILVLLAFFVVSNLHAQGAHRAAKPPATVNDGPNSIDLNDPFGVLRARPEPNSAVPARPAADPVPVSQLRIPSKAV